MNVFPGDIILIDFPFTIPTTSKVRPAVVLTLTKDKYRDIVICAISSVVPSKPSEREILIQRSHSSFSSTGLRVDSVIKIDRITTLRQADIIAKIGMCSTELWSEIVAKFRDLLEEKT